MFGEKVLCGQMQSGQGIFQPGSSVLRAYCCLTLAKEC